MDKITKGKNKNTIVFFIILFLSSVSAFSIDKAALKIGQDDLYYAMGATKPYTGKAVEWHNNGKKKTETHYKDGNKHGKELSWYETGMMEYEFHYRNGKKHGKETIWYKNGVKTESYFKEDFEHGKYTIWRDDGSVMSIQCYDMGNEIKYWPLKYDADYQCKN